ncbi:MAG TPA: hypothetical protein VN133_13520 [Humibacter sp.]|nr:hypothetical protein [Humibacter sp.]
MRRRRRRDLGGVGGGILITVQQSCLALGVALLGSLFLIVSLPHRLPDEHPGRATRTSNPGFGLTVGIQAALVVALVVATRILLPFTAASTSAPVE